VAEQTPRDAWGTGEEKVRRPSVLVGRMVASSRFFVLIATVSLFLAFMAVMVSTIIVTIDAIFSGISGGYTQNEMIGKLIKQADYALLATVLYVLALGLYSLFVDDRVPMPKWLRIHDLGHLKELLAGVVVVAIAVIFLGWALTWDGKSDILALGVASAAVIGGLALFLWQAARERQMETADRAAAARVEATTLAAEDVTAVSEPSDDAGQSGGADG
jgi:uncharacterized membrane protein YqhA